MTLYYFDIDDGSEHTYDKLGVELPDVIVARTEAAVLAGEMLRDRPDAIWGDQAWRMTVQGKAGQTQFLIEVGGVAAPAAASQVLHG